MVWIFQNFLLGCYQKMKNKRQAKPLGYHATARELNLLVICIQPKMKNPFILRCTQTKKQRFISAALFLKYI